jgi:hypothetical protein
LFHTDFAKLLKLDLEAGILAPLSGVHGSTADAYFHKIKIYVESDWVFEVLAGFIKGSNVNGLLGRHGFFDNFHVGFDHSVKPPEFEITRIQRPSRQLGWAWVFAAAVVARTATLSTICLADQA